MAAFQYTAVNGAAKEEQGIIQADSLNQARELLRVKGLYPLEIKIALASNLKSKPNFFSAKLSTKQLALITRQFATLLAAGLPIADALNAVAEQNEQAKLKSLLMSVRSKVLEGHGLAAAMRDYPHAFNSLYCATVAAGEKTGHLDTVLLRLADYTEQQAHIKQKLATALIYPTIMIFVAISIVSFLLAYVVPKMVNVYANMGHALPFVTQLLLSFSAFIKGYGWFFLVVIIGAIFTLRYMIKRSSQARYQYHGLILRLPLIGYSIKTSNTARFLRTVAILTASGLPALESMQIASVLITSMPIQDAVKLAVNKVAEGASIHLALKQTHYFSPMSIHMVASGESSGQLEAMLSRVADAQEQEVLRIIEVSLALFEPAIILVMGGVVLFIVLAILLPIFQMNDFT